LLSGFDLSRNQEGVWGIGFTTGRELALGGSVSFTGEKVPEYYEVPPQTWQGELYNLGPEYEVCLLAGTDFLMGISLELGIGISFQQRVHIATAEVPEGRLAPQRAAVLPNGYQVWERYFTFQGRLSLALEGGALDLGYHSRRGWVVGISLEF